MVFDAGVSKFCNSSISINKIKIGNKTGQLKDKVAKIKYTIIFQQTKCFLKIVLKLIASNFYPLGSTYSK
jgi:hypothetical protein